MDLEGKIKEAVIDVNESVRANVKIYRPFADSVRAGVGSVMCSYNRINGTYACESSQVLNYLLKNELSFQGFGKFTYRFLSSHVVIFPSNFIQWCPTGALSIAVYIAAFPGWTWPCLEMLSSISTELTGAAH